MRAGFYWKLPLNGKSGASPHFNHCNSSFSTVNLIYRKPNTCFPFNL